MPNKTIKEENKDWHDGYQIGYQEGYTVGYEAGYKEGVEDTLANRPPLKEKDLLPTNKQN